MKLPEPFHLSLQQFLAGPDGGELDIDDIFGKRFERLLEEFRAYAPHQIVFDADSFTVPSLVNPSFSIVEVDAGILLLDEERRPIGGYLSCDLSLATEYHGEGLGRELIIECALRNGALPTWHLDQPAYSLDGLRAHEAAWHHGRANPDELLLRERRLNPDRG